MSETNNNFKDYLKIFDLKNEEISLIIHYFGIDLLISLRNLADDGILVDDVRMIAQRCARRARHMHRVYSDREVYDEGAKISILETKEEIYKLMADIRHKNVKTSFMSNIIKRLDMLNNNISALKKGD